MRLFKSILLDVLLLCSLILVLCVTDAFAQEKQSTSARAAVASAKNPVAAKKQTPATATAETEEQSAAGISGGPQDEAEQIRKREEWFYKQRSSVNGHIPAGARLKAFQHMQRMMAAEGKLVQRPDGSYAAAVPQAGTSVGGNWNSIGPTPTTGGTFSPVTGRITTIAVDPSDSTGNTVLIGGAQGGIWRSTDGGNTWTPTGDSNPSLAMGSIAFAPSQPSIVYAGTGEADSVIWDLYYGAGVLKSTDGGLHWTQTCTVASSTCPFIGPYDDITPFGLFTLGGTRISYIAVNPSNPQMVLVGAQTQFSQGPTEGVYCSDNGGATWSNILPDQLSSFVGFVSSTVAYAALGNPFGSSPNAPNGNGIYKAAGIGGTCASVNFARLTSTSLPLQSAMGRIDLGIAPSDSSGNTIYASIADASADPVTGFRRASRFNIGIFKTTDGGNSWINTNAPDICRAQCEYDNVVKVDPLHSSIAFFGGSSRRDANGNPTWVVRTTDGGNSWSSVIPPLPALGQPADPGVPHVDNHAIAFAKLPTGKVRMYLGNDGGIWRTDDAEAATITWTNLNNSSLTLSQFYPSISIHPSTPAIGFGGTQDNGSQQLAGAPSWVQSTRTINTASGPVVGQACGDGGQTAVDSQIPSTVYISCQGISVQSSVLNGSAGSFVISINGINLTDIVSFIPPLATDPNAAGVLYFGTTGVYQSVDSAVTWTPITGPLANGPGDYIAVLAVAPGNSSVVYAGGFHGGVFLATNVGAGTPANFSQVSGQLTLPPRAATAIAVDPADKTGMTAYVTFSGFSFVSTSLGVNDPTGHVFKTTNGGATWTDVSCSVAVCTAPALTDLPNTPVNDIVVDPDLPGILYAATDEGVFVGDCTTAPCKWGVLSTGLPHVAVLSLRLHEPSRTLRAATHGRGAWDINLNNFSFSGPHISSITPTSANVGASNPIILTVNGSGLTNGTVQWNGSATNVTTTQVSDAQLTASIATALLASAGTPKITVVNGTQTSNAVTFPVLAATPTISSINPSSTPVQTNPTTNVSIQLTGTNFAAGAKVLFNGAQSGITVAAPTVSCPLPTCVAATLPAALLGPYGSTNDIAVLNVPPGGGKSKPVTFKVVAPPPPNDNFANGTNITTLNFNDTQDSSGATTETSDPTPPPTCVTQFTVAQGNIGGQPNGRYNTIWYKVTPQFSANLNLDTSGSNYDTVLSIWTGSPGSFVNVACNNGIVFPGFPQFNVPSQLLNVPLTVGTTYYVMVSSFGPPDPNPLALGGRSQLNFSYNNGFYPAPTISSVSPASANSGGPSFTLTVNGSGFLNGASIALQDPSFQSTPLTTTFVNSTQVTATVPASAILFPGNYQVLAFNPSPSGSTNFPFTVNLGTYPVPTLTSLGVNSIVAGSISPLTLFAVGANFAPSAVLNFNGTPQPTTVYDHQDLSASIPTSAYASAGTVQVTVSNPPPGGGPSNPLPFTIVAPNPLPTITSVSPSSIAVNISVTIIITGTGFLPGAVLQIGPNYPNFLFPSVNSSTQLSLALSFSNPGTYPIYVIDPAPGGTSAPFNFTVTGPPDFSVASTGTTTQTVNAGQTATFTNAITVGAQNGFSAQVNLSCSLPIAATATTCSVNPNTFATGSGTASISVTTMARGLLPLSLPLYRFYLRPEFVPLLLLTLLLAVLLLRFARTPRQRLAGALPLGVLVLFVLLQAIGCGGGSGYTPPPPTGTPAGTYTVTVTGTSGNTTHTATLTLMVN